MAIVHSHESGIPVNRCEEEAIRYCEDNLPNHIHVYHNLELIHRNGWHPYECDLILVGEAAAWIAEVKSYQGAIQGNASMWRLPNGSYEPSPIPLTNRKARILASRIGAKARDLKGKYYVGGLIILCNKQVKVDLDDLQSDRVIRLTDLSRWLRDQERRIANSTCPPNARLLASEILESGVGPLTVRRRIGDYELEDHSVVSRSKYSVTYLAKSIVQTRGRVALKVFKLDTALSQSELKRWQDTFMHEAEALNILGQHPNLIGGHDPFRWEHDKIVLPLDWVDGPSLRSIWAPNWSLRRRLSIFYQICEGLAHVHQKHVTHRALSSENVIVLDNDQVKLINFSLAKIRHDSLQEATPITLLLRTAEWQYRSPELWLSPHLATPKTDVFSAGVLFYELMTGRLPFSKQDLPLTPTKQFKRLTELKPSLPAEVDDLFLKMCRFDSNQRISMREAAGHVQALLARLPDS